MGTYAGRSDFSAGSNVGSLYIATDQRVVYQSQYVSNALVWTYVAGFIYDTLANRPTLIAGDVGVLFKASDKYQEFRWSGSAWVDITPGNELQIAYASGALNLSTTHADVPGATLTLNRAGRYLVSGTFFVGGLGAGDVGHLIEGVLSADGTEQAQEAVFTPTLATATYTMISQQWSYTPAASGKIVKLRAFKDNNTGTSTIGATHTCITALWLGP